MFQMINNMQIMLDSDIVLFLLPQVLHIVYIRS